PTWPRGWAGAVANSRGGGRRVRSIPRALRPNPPILRRDEPTGGLARVIVEPPTAALSRLRGEGALSIVLVEQNSHVALAFAPRTVVMDKGRIAYDGESSALRADPELLARLIRVSSPAPPPTPPRPPPP